MVAFGSITVKLWSLGIKTAAKPLARRFKKTAEGSQFWRSVFVGYAQWHHRMEHHISVRILGHPVREVKPLDETKAIADGSELLSEVFIFSSAMIAVVFELSRREYQDQHKKDEVAKKERMFKSELEKRLSSLELRIIELEEEKIRMKEHRMLLEGKKVQPYGFDKRTTTT